jgi:hypothetical protein
VREVCFVPQKFHYFLKKYRTNFNKTASFLVIWSGQIGVSMLLRVKHYFMIKKISSTLVCGTSYRAARRGFLAIVLFTVVSTFWSNRCFAQDRIKQEEQIDADRQRVAALCNQCPIENVNKLDNATKLSLDEFYKSHNVKPAVALKTTWSLLPVFTSYIPLEDRIWFCQYMINAKADQPNYPIEFLKSYLSELHKQNK